VRTQVVGQLLPLRGVERVMRVGERLHHRVAGLLRRRLMARAQRRELRRVEPVGLPQAQRRIEVAALGAVVLVHRRKDVIARRVDRVALRRAGADGVERRVDVARHAPLHEAVVHVPRGQRDPADDQRHHERARQRDSDLPAPFHEVSPWQFSRANLPSSLARARKPAFGRM
jgi:hypothetical protein